MKKLFFIPIGLFSLMVSAQTSIQLKNVDANQVLAPNAIIHKTTSALSNTKVTIDFKNTSTSSKTYNVRRYDVLLNVDASSETAAEAYFCFGGSCYGAVTYTSPTSLILMAGKSASDTSGQYCVLTADLDEAGVVASSIVKYTFFNINNISDSAQVTIMYNVVNVNNSFGFGNVTASSGTVDPTTIPSSGGFSYSPFTSSGNSANPTVPNAFSFSGWPLGATNGTDTPGSMTGQLNLSNYYSVTVNPAPGYLVTLTSIDFDVDRSASGSRNYAVRSSTDGYATNLPGSVTSNTNLSVNTSNVFLWNFDATFNSLQTGNHNNLLGAAFKNFAAPITFRFYSWNAEDANGSFALDNVVINGYAITVTGFGNLSHNLAAGFKVYPNPSSDGLVTLETNQDYSNIEILNIMGAKVLDQNNNNSDNKITLNLQSLPTGVYFVKISSGDKFTIEKLIISK